MAVAANLCAVAIGTETDGSVVSPASCSGIVGIKPTVGLLSRSGITPAVRIDVDAPLAYNSAKSPMTATISTTQGKYDSAYSSFLKLVGRSYNK